MLYVSFSASRGSWIQGNWRAVPKHADISPNIGINMNRNIDKHLTQPTLRYYRIVRFIGRYRCRYTALTWQWRIEPLLTCSGLHDARPYIHTPNPDNFMTMFAYPAAAVSISTLSQKSLSRLQPRRPVPTTSELAVYLDEIMLHPNQYLLVSLSSDQEQDCFENPACKIIKIRPNQNPCSTLTTESWLADNR